VIMLSVKCILTSCLPIMCEWGITDRYNAIPFNFSLIIDSIFILLVVYLTSPALSTPLR